MSDRRTLSATAAFVAVISLVPSATATPAGTAPLHLALPWHGADTVCPAGYSATTECHPHTSPPVAVPGLGFVSESYVFAFETASPACASGFVQVVPYPARLTVRGRGEILLALDGSDRCVQADPTTTALLDLPQAFTVTGGSGAFAGASGSGIVSRSDTGFGVHGFGTDHWEGTLSAPNFEQDLTPPVIRGAANKRVTAPRRAETVRVHYTVMATDDVDGAVPVVCSPRSGTRFKVARPTTVHCSATDKSANTEKATFVVTVRRSKH